MFISKTDYILWRACHKNAWLRLHKPEIFDASEVTEYEQAVMDTGVEVECVARALFPNGVLVTGPAKEAEKATAKYIASNVGTLFNATFQHESLMVATDVLQFDPSTASFSLYEVKSSTREEPEHLYDLAFQVSILRQLNLPVRRACILHLNPRYVRDGGLNIQQLFVTNDLTAKVDSVSQIVAEEAKNAEAYLLNEVEPAGPCSCIYSGRSKHCTTFPYSNPTIPAYGVHDIARIGSNPKKLKELVDAGVFSLEEVPADVKLTDIQRIQLSAYRNGTSVIDKRAIAEELGEVSYPIHFIDYETFAPAIPVYPQYSPYDQIPLQYSVHIVGAPNEEPMHRDFLHPGRDDPSESFFQSLQQHIAPFGSIVVWNKGFESHVNDCIARRLPATKDYFVEFNDRLYDLMDIFSKQYFVHKDLFGKTSIKKVLPVLVPELSYSPLQIQDGAAASLVWSKLISSALSKEESDQLYKHLREYCALDSYGMFAIWRALLAAAESENARG
jgi:hypothetical protein